MIFALTALAFILATGFTYYLASPRAVLTLLDEPNARSLHTRPTPVTGGIAILSALLLTIFIASFWFEFPMPLIWVAISCILVAMISLLDDWRDLSPAHRLLIHFIAAYLLLSQGQLWVQNVQFAAFHWTLPNTVQMFGSLFLVVWWINLYNFMDGMDGFAGGMTVCGFVSLAILGILGGHTIFVLLNSLIVGATLGFLIFNYPPARIFMGDTGSSSLGLLAAAMSLWGTQLGLFPLWIALLIFSPFIVDSTVTLIRRLVQGEKIWLAHRSHYYQRLVQLGWGHKRTVLTEYVLMLACSLSAIWALHLSPTGQGIIIGIWCMIYPLLILGVHRLIK